MASRKPEARPLPPHWFHILLSLADQDLNGLQIMDAVLERTEGSMRLWPAMLYRNLARLVDEELVVEIEPPRGAELKGGRPRFYRITPAGRRACAREAERLARYLEVARHKKVFRT